MTTLPRAEPGQARRWSLVSLAVAGAAWLACLVGGLWDPAQFFRAYLAAYVFFWGLALGGLALLMIYHLTGGAWGYLVRRPLEALAQTIPLLALLFLPVAFGVRYLYVWAESDIPSSYHHLSHLKTYLNVPFFLGRAAVYFALWCLLAWLLGRWSRLQDDSDDPGLVSKSATLSGPGLVIYGLTLHFAAVDWIMSIQTLFHSSIIGPLVATGHVLSAYAFALVLFCWIGRPVADSDAFSRGAMNDLGGLLLAFLVLWCYAVWFWFLLIWIVNEPAEIIWMLPRWGDFTGNRTGIILVLILNVVLPFFLLLLRAVKQRPALLGSLAGLIVAMHLLFVMGQVLPAYEARGLDEQWMNFLTPFAIGGVWFAAVLWRLGRRPLLVRHDVNRHRAARLREMDEEAAERREALAREA